SVKYYKKADGLSSLMIQSIVENADGTIFFGTSQGVAYVDTDLNLHMLEDARIKDEYIRTLACDGKDTIYGTTKNNGVFMMVKNDFEGYVYYDNTGKVILNAHTIFADPENESYVYIGTTDSKIYYGKFENGFELVKEINCDPLSYINCIKQIGDKLWICADNGIGYIEDNKLYVLDNLPMNSSVTSVMTDYLGNLWFTSSKQGIMKIVLNHFTDVFAQYGLEETVVNATCMLEDKLFIGSKTDGITVIQDDKILKSLPVKESASASGFEYEDTDLIEMLDECRIRSIYRDSSDRLWISTFSDQGLIRYDHGEVLKFTLMDDMPSERVRAVLERSDGSFAVCCTGGLVIIRDDKVESVYDEHDGLTNLEILTCDELDNGDLVIGTDGDGLYIISESGITHIGTDQGLSSDIVMRVKKDISRDILWIITSNSICYMKPDHSVTLIKNFPYSNNFDLYENQNGKMWVLSSDGIYVVSVDEMLENGEITSFHYGMANGLSCITTSNSYSEVTEEGDMYISGTSGVIKVNIENGLEDINDFKMSVPFVVADGDYIFPDEKGNFNLSSDVNKLTIYSYVFNYSLMDPVISYKLEGKDTEAVKIKESELSAITYTDLEGGKYSFVLSIENPKGLDPKELRVGIIKEQAVYEVPWVQALAVVIVIIILLLLVQLYINLRTRHFMQKANEQKELTREIVEAFAKVIDMKDKYTNGHSFRVARYTAMLATQMGYDEDTVEKYYNIALLHDIGKIGIPPEVLNKQDKLNGPEYNIIEKHPVYGYEILKNISVMPDLAIGAEYHHERIDGKGYPNGLKGDEIPKVAQIIAVADTFDAMYSDRPYRKRMNFDKVVEIMKQASGTQLASDVVDAFLKLVEKGEFKAADDIGEGSTENIDNTNKI
nr:HD domain-containing protein [Butyrivibrio sp.]